MGLRCDNSEKQSRKDLYHSIFHPNPYAKYNTGAGIMQLHCLRRQCLHFFPKYCFQEVTLNHKRLLLASLMFIYLAVLTPRVQSSLQHTLSQIPSGSSSSFLPLPLIQRFFWSDCSHSLGVIAPCQHQRKHIYPALTQIAACV